MSGMDLRKYIYSFCQALTSKNIDVLQSLLTYDTIFSWGPYRFEGKDSILNWAKELWELFPVMAFQEKSLEVYESNAKHEFVIAFTTPEGRKGWLPCIGVYKFKDNKITQLDVKLLHGYVAVNRDEIERVKPHPTK
jgi:hypothetical protein